MTENNNNDPKNQKKQTAKNDLPPVNSEKDLKQEKNAKRKNVRNIKRNVLLYLL